MRKDINCFLYTLSSLLNNQPPTQHPSFSEKALPFHRGYFINAPLRRQPAILTPYCYFNSTLLLVSLQFGNEQLRLAKYRFFYC